MNHFVVTVLLTTVLLLHQSGITSSETLQLEYFTSTSLECNENKLNTSNNSIIKQKYWLIPAGVLLNQSTTNGHLRIDLNNFTLTIDRINDPDFGKYYCLLVRSDFSIDNIEYGINVDGPYYGDLLQIYSKKAMIGGIAAGSLFAVVAGSCTVWQLRYRNKNKRNKAVDEKDKATDGFDMTAAYENAVMESDERNVELNGQVSTTTEHNQL